MRFFCKVMMLGTLLFALNANSAVDIELTQGIAGSIPVAVAAFEGQGYLSSDPQNVTAVIDSDLNHSGRVKSLAAAHDPARVSGLMPAAFWRGLGADYVVNGHVKSMPGGHYAVDFKLQSIAANAGAPQDVLAHNFTATNAGQLRSLAHHISDLIYEKLTGERGVFQTRIAYVVVQRANNKTRYALEIADMDGFNPKTLLGSPHPIMSPAWSPDGKKIAYVSFEKGRSQVYISDVSTGQRRLVTDFRGINGAPAWSPDGQRLAVALSKKEAQPHIYVVSLATGSDQQITDGWSIDTEPAWSNNGQTLIFTSDRGGAPQIYQVNLLNNQIDRVTYAGNYNASASYSPDGKQVVMLHRMDSQFNIALLDLTSGRLTELTDAGVDESPSMAPNGSMVLYATRQGGRGILGMVSTDGRIKLRLPSRNGDVREPAWSPFLS
jgi:TolB protein